ncbi:hypothetical protein ACIPLC_26715 [Kitasatospora sp. NPDC086801]|uniref:hypothetical protein n=1 Tax=Kitasatospora sp. NPDC086801 TaxID=3364066 RepID=UPI00381B8A7C
MASTIALLEVRQPAVQERIRRAEAELAAATAEQEAIAKALEGLRLLASGTPLDGAGEPHAGGLPAAPAAGAVREAAAAAEPADRRVAPSPSGPAAAAVRAGKTTTAKNAKKKAAATRADAAKTAAPAPERKEQASAPAARKTARKTTAKDSTRPKAAAQRTTIVKETARAKAAPAGGKPPVKAAAPAAGRRRQVTDADSVLEVLSKAGKPLRAREVLDLLGLDASEGNINALRTRLERLARDGRTQRPGRGLYTVTDGRPETGK